MSVATQIARILQDRNAIRTKLAELGVAQNADGLDELAAAVDGIEDRGAVSAAVQEGEAYTIPKGYHNGSGTVSGVSNGASVPAGGIIMWSGATVPDGWALCNGENGTPDLRGRFIYGAGESAARLVFTSTNQGQGNKNSEMTVVTRKALGKLGIEYLVSSEVRYDKFSVYQGDSAVIDSVSGENVSGSVAIEDLPAGTTFRFVYAKDVSGDKFDDQVRFWLTVDDADISSEEEFGELFQVTQESEFRFSREAERKGFYPVRGEVGGSSSVTLLADQLPSHFHNQKIGVNGSLENMGYVKAGSVSASRCFGIDPASVQELSGEDTGGMIITGSTGNGEPFSVLPPYYALAYIMKL